MKRILPVLLFAAFTVAAFLMDCTEQQEDSVEKITVVNAAVPVYKFTIPPGDAFGNYTQITARFLVDADNYRRQARVRAYGNYPREYFVDTDGIFFLDFGVGGTDKNGPYLVSNVIGVNRNLSVVSGNAGPNTWFTLEFPLYGEQHPNYNPVNFPDNTANGDVYFALGLGTGNASFDLTYYVKEVTLTNDDGSKRIVSKGSGFEKPAFAGYPANIAEIHRSPVNNINTIIAAGKNEYDDPSGYYFVREIYPWLYSIYDPENVYCYLMVGSERALLYDTVYGIGSLPDVIRNITDKPVTVVLGHGHLDHVNGAYQFDEAWLHEADFELCREEASEDARRDFLDYLEESGQILPDNFDADAYMQAGAGNLRKLEIGQVFDLGGLHVEVVGMEGHTAGSVGLLAREHRVLLDSDAASSHTWVFLPESLLVRQYIAMLRRTMQLDFDTFFTGHSDAPMPKAYFKKILNVALNASLEKAAPYAYYGRPGLNPFIYQEDGTAIVFAARKNIKSVFIDELHPDYDAH